MSELQQFDRFEATLQPHRVDDLKPGAKALIAQRFRWEAMYRLDDEEMDPEAYRGQFACLILNPPLPRPDFVWVPECDLADIELLPEPQSMTQLEGGEILTQ